MSLNSSLNQSKSKLVRSNQSAQRALGSGKVDNQRLEKFSNLLSSSEFAISDALRSLYRSYTKQDLTSKLAFQKKVIKELIKGLEKEQELRFEVENQFEEFMDRDATLFSKIQRTGKN